MGLLAKGCECKRNAHSKGNSTCTWKELNRQNSTAQEIPRMEKLGAEGSMYVAWVPRHPLVTTAGGKALK